MTTEASQPATMAFNKLYFVNMFATKKDNVVCNDFMSAKLHYPRLAKIAEKLAGKDGKDLQYIIEEIESIQ